jgi:hypothetical protein
MEYLRMTLVLSEDEMDFLCKAARRELRKPRDHARHLIRTALLNNADRLNASSDVNIRQDSHVAAAL